MTRPYADSVQAYALAGWPCILPVPVETKGPPPVGYTGEHGRDTDPLTLVQWAGSHGDWSVALRMPDGVIGIDVDHYVKGQVVKRGADSLAEHEQRWGPLPPTWISTARGVPDVGPGPSGIRLYRVPPGRYATKLGESIEIIQRHHRYAVVWPSRHTGADAPYRWYAPDGRVATRPPAPGELPELPEAWVAGLRDGATEASPPASSVGEGQELLARLLADDRPPCARMANARSSALRQMDAAAKTGFRARHDVTSERVHHVVQLGAEGHSGAGEVLRAIAERWAVITAGERREDEHERMVLTAARKAVTKYGALPPETDPCAYVEALPTGALTPPDQNAEPGAADDGPPPERDLHPLEVLGTGLFDPRAGLDQTIAAAVLDWTRPVLRYATDVRTWLLRGRDRWRESADLAEWAVALAAARMPTGDPSAEKGSEERERADRRKRLMTGAGAGGVARKIRALVAGGAHPSTLRLAELDVEPWLLWAGGVPWDLRACIDVPTPAVGVPWDHPHLKSARYAPDPRVSTPRWDAYVQAVLPDPEIRAYTMRMLAVGLTGYPDAVVPLLFGAARSGKTSLLEMLVHVLGSYAGAANPKLLQSGTSEHDTIVYELKGLRLAFIDEGPRRDKHALERFKQLTGGGSLTGRAMRKDPITFQPTHTLAMTANPENEPYLADAAVRARVRVIPCDTPEAVVRPLRMALAHGGLVAEAPGILATMMREAALYLADRSSVSLDAAPAAVRSFAEGLAAEQNPIDAWVTACTVPTEQGSRTSELYDHFVRWHQDQPRFRRTAPATMTAFGRRLTELGYPQQRRSDANYRPLEVLSGGYRPWLTPPPSAEVLMSAGGGSVGGLWGVEHKPSTPQNSRSEAVSSVGVEGVEGFTCSTTENKKRPLERIHTEGMRDQPSTVHTASEKGGLPAQTRVGGRSTRPSTRTASRADTAKTTKATKQAAKIAEKQAKIDAAAGPRVPLPAACDRAGQIRPLDIAGALQAVRHAARTAGELTVDVETTGYPVGHRHYALRTVQLGSDSVAVVFDPTDAGQADAIRTLLAEAPRLVAHSATADLVPLVHAGLCGMDAWERMWDTVLPAKLADPASTGSTADGLKQLARDVLGDAATAPAADAARGALWKAAGWLKDTKPDTPVERSGWARVDSTCTTMIRYGASDVLDTAALARRLPALPPALAERERAVQRITARIAHHGLRLDGSRVERLHSEHTAAQRAAADRVRAYGVENPGSDREIARRLTELGVTLPRTPPSARHPQGQPSVAEAVLARVRDAPGDAGGLARAVLDYREHSTALSLILEPFRQSLHGDGRVRSTIYTLSADTGRMSSVRQNLQQITREGGFRPCITADPGYLLVSADFAAVEVRVMAALSQDQNLIRFVREGVDLHAVVAEAAFGPQWTKSHRYTAKRGVFGWAYGGGVPTIAAQLGVPESVVERVIAALRQIAPGYVAWADQLKASVRSGVTQMPTNSGRVIHLPPKFPHKAPNFCIQGTARELLVDALLRWDSTVYGGGIVLPVHDEIVAMVPEEQAEAATTALVECMTTELYGVPIVAEADPPSFEWRDAT